MVFSFDSEILALIVLFLWVLGLTFFLYRYGRHYQRLVKGQDKKNLTEILNAILKEIKISKEEIEKLKERTTKIEKENVFYFQRAGLVKFNPFKEIGGKQSFILALLDKEKSGVLITSLHGRETTRWYVKIIKKGKAVNFELSKEEKEAIEKAQ